MANPKAVETRALIHAPLGRDAPVARGLLAEAGMEALISADLADFAKSLGDEICLAVITEEAVRSADLRAIASWVNHQPPWSDLAFIVLTQRGGGPERNPAAARLSDVFGNVTFLERPFHPTTFISLARSAKKGRRRQYEIRARIDEMKESEGHLHTALVAGRLGSWQLDLETNALHASATCKSFFGREPSDTFTYEDLLASIHPDDRARVLQAVRSSIENTEDYAIEHRVIWPDQTIHWTEIRARNVGDSRSRRSLVGVSSDITERKTAEAYMRRLNETLEERVAARTTELQNAHSVVLEEIAQRQRAEELLRRSQRLEMIGQLTGGVAHDFNNLLMAVIGNLDLLTRHTGEDPKTKRLLEGALLGAKRGAALTQRLLAFARRQDLTVEPIDLVELVGGMTDLLYRSIGDRIELTLDLPSTLPLTMVDANQIELALLNLVVNARDAMPEGGSITISADTTETAKTDDLKAGTFVRLIVRDTGQGMSPETLKKATEPFFSTKEVGKGTGLGLSMIHGLALQLNGALRLRSKVNDGTTAELWLPVTAQTAKVRPEAPARSLEPGPKPERLTILVVDDDALIAASTVDMLEDLGHEVIDANCGADALAILSGGQRFDLMVTDYSMPKMTGTQLAAAAREIKPNLPILLATGYADLPAGSEINLPRLGKPYQQDQLAAEITKLLRGREAV
ncbi:MAG: ATP-binding protein [Hyphomicrobiaceae bacterium]|nr:ATP-binding protein [Hyphomicrobiaceae bacterium]